VHRGALVSLGYWNDPAKTAERFKPFPTHTGLPCTELAVWSGDVVTRDAEGYLYFVSRNDEMIKTSGYRVSPTEVEEVAYARLPVTEVAALGVPHPLLGQAIVLAVCLRNDSDADAAMLLAACKPHLPAYMLPQKIVLEGAGLPRNQNGKIDRKLMAERYGNTFVGETQ
jgi:acyl-CoA synthetase (AMP-forming)/AMP-acid ligase II